jgi:hypothetical protein
MDRTPFDTLSVSLAAAVQRLEESRDRLLLAQTRMQMAAEQAEFAFARFGAAADQLGARLRDAELGN